MDKREIVGLPLSVPSVIQGATPLFGQTLVEEPERLLDDVFSTGINAFDSGLTYADEAGSCDERLGGWVTSRGVRDEVTIIGKGCHPGPPDWSASRVTPENVAKDVSISCSRMGVDRIDLWLFHRDDESVPVPELVDAASHEVSAGNICAWGVSNWSFARLKAAVDYAEEAGLVSPCATSPHFSLVDQLAEPWPGVTTITGDTHGDARQWFEETGLPVLAWSSLASGFLTSSFDSSLATFSETVRCYGSEENMDRRARAASLAAEKGCDLEQIAVAYILAAPFPTFATCAARSLSEAEKNVAASEIQLTGSEYSWLHDGN